MRDPVIITKNGRPRTVLLAYEDYLRLMRRERRVELTSVLAEDDLAAVETASMEAGLEHLDRELNEK
ncbi:type II toxin-antitoxin system [compost metagenome]